MGLLKKKIYVPVLGGLMLLSQACSAPEQPMVRVYSDPDRKLLAEFKVEVADDPQERSTGLMFRTELGQDRGMFFVFPHEVDSPFWMRNTLIPLDMLFIDSEKRILNIVSQAQPQTDTPRLPKAPYLYVLEIEGGRAKSLGLKEGDRMEWEEL